jgi:hypothetical protein
MRQSGQAAQCCVRPIPREGLLFFPCSENPFRKEKLTPCSRCRRLHYARPSTPAAFAVCVAIASISAGDKQS